MTLIQSGLLFLAMGCFVELLYIFYLDYLLIKTKQRHKIIFDDQSRIISNYRTKLVDCHTKLIAAKRDLFDMLNDEPIEDLNNEETKSRSLQGQRHSRR